MRRGTTAVMLRRDGMMEVVVCSLKAPVPCGQQTMVLHAGFVQIITYRLLLVHADYYIFKVSFYYSNKCMILNKSSCFVFI